MLLASKASFNRSHKAYEEEEGIIAGVPSLARYDVIMDSGTSAKDDPKTAVPFSLTLPDGRVLRQPGQLLPCAARAGVVGHRPAVCREVVGQGRSRRRWEGRVRRGAARRQRARGDHARLRAFARESDTKARAWKPTGSDVLTALVVMVPTMEGYFGEWKSSRSFSATGAGEGVRRALTADRRARDPAQPAQHLFGCEAPGRRSGAAQSNQIGSQLNALSAFVDGIYAKETAGKQFRPNEADLLGSPGAEAGERDRRSGQPGRRRTRDQATGLRADAPNGRRARCWSSRRRRAPRRQRVAAAAAAPTEPWQAYQQLDTGPVRLQLGVTLGDAGQTDRALAQVDAAAAEPRRVPRR